MHPISRRSLLLNTLAPPRRKVLICLIDGFGVEYLEASDMPNLRRLMKEGLYRAGASAMPSLTNVNHASLVTGLPPERHGITANSFFDRRLGRAIEMSSSSYLLQPTLLETARRLGWKTAFVGAKHKLCTLFGHQADVVVSAEQQAIPMYEAANSYWVFNQGRSALRRPEIDLLYLTTSDYMMHTYPPESAESQEHLHRLDAILGGIVDDHPNLELYFCADHGMNAKNTALDPVRLLAARGIRARAAAAIADAHKVHHQDLGGSLYLDLENPAQAPDAQAILRSEPGIDDALPRSEACRRFRLFAERTGDLFILGARHVALGSLPVPRVEVQVRTHGSLHETRIPLLVYGRRMQPPASIDELTARRPWEGPA